MPSPRRTRRALALAIPLVLLLASCGDDEPDGASAAGAGAVDIDTRDQWCAVVGEADDEDAAIAAVEDVFGVAGIQSDGPGATWILDNCEVNIDG